MRVLSALILSTALALPLAAPVLAEDAMTRTISVTGTGNVDAEQRYKPWGEGRPMVGTLPTDYRFTGQREASDVGLYQMGARWYDPYLNRFIQPDTVVPNPGDPQSLNRFSYSRNNPVRYSDPTGHLPKEEILQHFGV